MLYSSSSQVSYLKSLHTSHSWTFPRDFVIYLGVQFMPTQQCWISTQRCTTGELKWCLSIPLISGKYKWQICALVFYQYWSNHVCCHYNCYSCIAKNDRASYWSSTHSLLEGRTAVYCHHFQVQGVEVVWEDFTRSVAGRVLEIHFCYALHIICAHAFV